MLYSVCCILYSVVQNDIYTRFPPPSVERLDLTPVPTENVAENQIPTSAENRRLIKFFLYFSHPLSET